ncbi:hypothetical protein [Lacrimispora sp.]|uniref:hypothetical protein n=1 Tax=Lacrimispora sp. TaxID=2719234 RepID=UPI0028A7868A|nr:hypothetical protein [Lacrimispora sp.]
MTATDVTRYLALVDRRMFPIEHSGMSWRPEYGPELNNIDQELVKLRKEIDAEHIRRKEIAH